MQDFQEQEVIKPIAFNIIDKHFTDQPMEPILRQTYHIFADIEEWKNFVKNYKFALGYRVHGSILSLNSGVPAVCLNADSRATEMCSFLKIPHRPDIKITNENDILNVYKEIDVTELNKNYPNLYDNFIDFLHRNHLQSYEENTELLGQLNYMHQPQLTLYSDTFYSHLENAFLGRQSIWQEFCHLLRHIGQTIWHTPVLSFYSTSHGYNIKLFGCIKTKIWPKKQAK